MSLINSCSNKNGPSKGDEGGFSYVIFAAVTVIAVTCALPLGVFGIVFGKFLATLGDETTGISMANGIFNTVLSLTGLAANVLLNKWTCRSVGLLGALFSVLGSFALVLPQNFPTFMLFYGIFQGFGYGLLLPASLTALNDAFDKKLTFMASLSQALMVACCMLMPPGASAAMDSWGFRGTTVCLAAIALVNFPAAAVLTEFRRQPAKSVESEIAFMGDSKSSVEVGFAGEFKREMKILHIADRAPSIASLKLSTDNETGYWKSLIVSPKYLNIAIGASLSFTSDICFVTLMPLILSDLGFDGTRIAFTLSIFFGSDLIGRIMLAVVTSRVSVKNRYLVLGGSLFSVIFRVGFLWCSSDSSKIITLAILGFLRCFIQTPIPLVMAEEYQDNFATAFSLYMVVCGLLTLVFGPLTGWIKSATGSNEMVCHLLTSCYVICVIAWLTEMTLELKHKKDVIKSSRQQPSGCKS